MPGDDGLLVQHSREFRARLLRRDAATLKVLAARWRGIEGRLLQRSQQAAARIAAAKADGREVTRHMLNRDARFLALLDQVAAEIARYEDAAAADIAAAQRAALSLGLDDAALLAKDAGFLGGFNVLPAEAVRVQVGHVANGAPLKDYLHRKWPAAAVGIGDKLVEGVALGLNPQVVARSMVQQLQVLPVSALRIARTETLRAYREATLTRYAADGVPGYVWVSAKSLRTCFQAGVLVETATGPKPIEQVRVGEMVWTGERRLRRVKVVMRKPYSGRMVTLRTAAGVTVEATETHPVLVHRQGKLQWVAAGQIVAGDTVYRGGNRGMQNIEHVLVDFSVERGIRQAHDDVAPGLQAEGLAPVGVGALVPVHAVDFEGDVAVGQVEIDRVAVDSGFLGEAFAHQIEAATGVTLWHGFAGALAVASRAAKLLIGHGGHNAECSTAGLAGENDRGAAARLAAILPVWCTAKQLAATFANMVDVLGERGVARRATAHFCVGLRRIKAHDLPAVRAWLFDLDAASGFVAGTAAKRAWLAGVTPENLTTVSTGGFGALALGNAVAFGTTAQDFFARDHRRRPLECLVANWTDKLNAHYARAPILVFSDIVTQVVFCGKSEVTVYNLEVDEDHTYFANGLLVHNCIACLLNDGKWFPVSTPFADHVNGRCTPIPRAKEDGPTWLTGRDYFLKLDEDGQRRILGDALYDGWRGKRFALEDLPYERHHPIWGNAWQVRGAQAAEQAAAHRRLTTPPAVG